jgi:hypothetical protein
MHLILSFLTLHLAALWKDGDYHITGSQNSRVNGGNAVLFVESPKVRLRFTCDRGQLWVDIQSPFGPEDKWFSAGLLWRVLRDVVPASDLLDEKLAGLLITELSRIEDMMRAEHFADTYAALHQAAVERSRELFG